MSATPEARLAVARKMAKELGGKLLSDAIGRDDEPLLWKCRKGHEWQGPVARVRNGVWCKQCQLPSLDDMKRLAESRGGTCLATEYVGTRVKVPWQCAHGHRWMSHWTSVRIHWCPKCASLQKLELKEFQRIAKERGGKLMSKAYVNSSIPMQWRCAKGHKWWAAPFSVKDSRLRKGSWCAACQYEARRGQPQVVVNLEDLQRLARDRGGECLSVSYTNTFTKMKWRCVQGHEWMATRNSIQRHWCPQCAKRLKFEHIIAAIGERGGHVLSSRAEFVDYKSRLEWECARGHRWKDTVKRVKGGVWCTRCKTESHWTLKDLQDLAAKRNSVCLSKKYLGWELPLRWRCGEGHAFSMTPRLAALRKNRKHWCPVCQPPAKYTLGHARRFGGEKGFRCLSQVYVNNSGSLIWQCSKGHKFRKPLKKLLHRDSALSGCPVCRKASGKSVER